MTLQLQSAARAIKTRAGVENNPHVLWDDLGGRGTWTTDEGTEIESASHLSTGTTYDPWIVEPMAGATLFGSGFTASAAVDLGSSQAISFVALAAHNLAQLGDDGFVIVETRRTSSGAWELFTVSSTQRETGNDSFGFIFRPFFARFWRIRIFSLASVKPGNIEIGTIFLGRELIIPQRIYQGYAPPITPNRVEIQSNVSEGSHLLGAAEIRRGSSVDASFSHIDPQFLRSAEWMGFQRHYNSGKGFFWAWRPATWPDLHFAWREGGPIAPDNSGPQRFMSFDMQMRFHSNAP